MSNEELKSKISKILDNTQVVFDRTIEPGEIYVYTGIWKITTEQLESIRRLVCVSSVCIEGHALALVINTNKPVL